MRGPTYGHFQVLSHNLCSSSWPDETAVIWANCIRDIQIEMFFRYGSSSNIILAPLALYSGRGVGGEGQRTAILKCDLATYAPLIPSPSPPGYRGRREPEMILHATMNSQLLKTVSSVHSQPPLANLPSGRRTRSGRISSSDRRVCATYPTFPQLR